MSLTNTDPPSDSEVRSLATGVTRTRTSRASASADTSPAPLGFEVLLREINTVVELLERLDEALDNPAINNPAINNPAISNTAQDHDLAAGNSVDELRSAAKDSINDAPSAPHTAEPHAA